jgi:hypothetical protein
MKYISAQPDELYFAWQVEVMLDNFLSVGILPSDIHILVGIKKHIGNWWPKLIEKYDGVGFFFYEDELLTAGRMDKTLYYPPAIRPYILFKHWKRFPELEREIIFYHDSDILFTSKSDFSKFLNDDIWYVSDTRSYIGASYIRSKGENIYLEMCKIVGIDPIIPIENEHNSGGAQYLMKNVNWRFWRLVQYVSENIYKYLSSSGSDIQSWTADMWSLLWLAWRDGYKTKIDRYLDFSMATDTWPKWDKNLIYHNAGAVSEHEGKLFIKDQFRHKLPYMEENPYDNDFCSYYYFDHVIKTGKNSCLIEKKPDVQTLIEQCKTIFIGI